MIPSIFPQGNLPLPVSEECALIFLVFAMVTELCCRHARMTDTVAEARAGNVSLADTEKKTSLTESKLRLSVGSLSRTVVRSSFHHFIMSFVLTAHDLYGGVSKGPTSVFFLIAPAR